ncbi:hypothetical protein PG993_010898 [Apiospora rasikravindrae]|uniref:Ysc84 actin-binding domain-containing protein n=1 Tax=Apiospora rasikravindrae TaxID=990691 RepID=A0ABR1SEY0_9PEZI
MEKEIAKAQKILKSFTKEGVDLGSSSPSANSDTNKKSRGLAKIPAEVIQQAKGIAIFTTVRAGMWVSGSAGSGVVMARLPDGSNDWSPPSAFSAYTVGAGVILGADHTESVCMLNTDEAVRAFTQDKFGFGAGLSVTAGPVGAGTDSLHDAKDPVWIYSKSRGIFLGAQVDGTRFNARDDINEGFYGEEGITPERILRGEVKAELKEAAKGIFGSN